MPADAGVETTAEVAPLSRAEFVELLGARIRTLTNYDIERLNEMLESAWLGTKLTWRANVTQRGSDVPDDVLSAIPLVRLADVPDYWNMINRPGDTWRDGIVDIVRTVALRQTGRGIPTQLDHPRLTVWSAWPLASLRLRRSIVAVFATIEACLIGVSFGGTTGFASLIAYVASVFGWVFVLMPFVSVQKSQSEGQPVEVRFIDAVSRGVAQLSSDDLGSLHFPEVQLAERTDEVPFPVELSTLDWDSFGTREGLERAVGQLNPRWRIRVINAIDGVVQLEQMRFPAQPYWKRLELASPVVRARARVGWLVVAAALIVYLAAIVLVNGFLHAIDPIPAALFPAILFGSLGVHLSRVPDRRRQNRLDEIAQELAAA
jgi:hypothetical protein